MTKGYATTLGFGLVGLVLLATFFDSRRLDLAGQDSMDVFHGSAFYTLFIVFLFAYAARLIFWTRVPSLVRLAVRVVITVSMVTVVVGTVIGCALAATGQKYELFAIVFLGFAVLSSISSMIWLIRFNKAPSLAQPRA